MVEPLYLWQYLRRDTGRPFGTPQTMTTAEAEAAVARIRIPFLIAFNTETGDVIW